MGTASTVVAACGVVLVTAIVPVFPAINSAYRHDRGTCSVECMLAVRQPCCRSRTLARFRRWSIDRGGEALLLLVFSAEALLISRTEEAPLIGRTEAFLLIGRTEEVILVGRTEKVRLIGRTEEIFLIGRTVEVRLIGRTEEVLLIALEAFF